MNRKLKKVIYILLAIAVTTASALIIFFHSLKGLVEGEISKALGAETKIEKLALNPFTGFTLEGLSLHFPGDSLPQTVEEITLRYSPLDLLKRRLRITRLKIESPRLYLSQRPEGVWNFLASIPSPSPDEEGTRRRTQPSDTAVLVLPVRVLLEKFNLEGLKLELRTHNEWVIIDSGGIEAANVCFNSTEDFSGKIETAVFCGSAGMSAIPAGLSFRIQMGAAADRKGGDFNLDALLRENSDEFTVPEMNLKIAGDINLSETHIALNRIELKFGDGKAVNLMGDGELRGWSALTPRFRLAVSVNALNIYREFWLFGLLGRQIQDIPHFKHNLKKPLRLSLEGEYSRQTGNLSVSCSLDYASAVSDVTSLSPPASLENLDLTLSLAGGLSGDSIYVNKFNLNVEAGDLAITVSDHSDTLALEKFIVLVNHQANQLFADFRLEGLKNSSVKGKAVIEVPPNLNSFKPSLESLKSLEIAAEGVKLESFGAAGLIGEIEAELNMTNRNKILSYGLEIRSVDCLNYIRSDTAFIALPLDTLKSEGRVYISDDFSQIRADSVSFSVSNWLNLLISADYWADSLQFSLVKGVFDLAELRRFPSPAEMIPAEAAVQVDLSGGLSLPLKALSNFSAGLKLHLRQLDHLDIGSIKAENASADVSIGFRSNTVELKAEAAVARAVIPKFRPRPFDNISFSIEGRGKLSNKMAFIASSILTLPSEGFKIKTEGEGAIGEDGIILNLAANGAFEGGDGLEIVPGVSAGGIAGFTLNCRCDSLAVLKGNIKMRDFSLYTALMEISGMNGQFPLNQTLDMKTMTLRRISKRENPFYRDSRSYLAQSGGGVENLRARSVQLFGREMSDFKADARWEGGYFILPHFQMTLFEGNMAGEGWLRVDSLQEGKVSYYISAAGAEINSDLISQLRTGGGEKSRISFNFNFQGRELDPAHTDFDLSGEAHITKISPRVAENLLLALDPKQEDKGIQSMLYFLSRGWGVKSFSFELSHGFVYSTIITQQPPLSKPLPFMVSRVLPLEKEIRLSRLPLKFFIQ